MKFLILLLIQISFAFAEPDLIEHKFRPDYWTKGLHLNAGGGMNITHFDSNDRYDEIGYGLNFKTDLGYYFTNRFAIEWSSNVKFNRVNNFLIWDSLFTAGLRYRIKEYYVRAFYGKAPTVVFFNGNPPEGFENSKASRFQYDGPVYGIAIGKMFKTDAGLIWFIETSQTYQRLEEREAIHMDGQVPEVIGREKDSSTVLSVYFMVGILIF
jgi:hypothetical protein